MTPPAYATDVASVDAIITAMYDVISGPAGPRDWERERHLFHPAARMMRGLPAGTPAAAPPVTDLRVFTPDEFIEHCKVLFVDRDFYEIEIGREEFRFGRWVHVISAYESRLGLDQPPYARGINSVQLWWDGRRWWIMNVIWDWESTELPIPAHLTSRGGMG